MCSKLIFGRQKNEIANIIKTPEGLIQGGLILDPKILYKEMQKNISRIKEYSNNVAVSIFSPQIKTKTAKINKSNLNEVIYRQQLANKDYFSDYKILEKSGDILDVMQVNVPKNIIQSYIEFFNLADLNCQKIDFIGNSLSKIKILNTAGTTAIVDIGSRHTNVVIQKDGKFEDYRVLNHGGFTMTNAIAKALNIDFSPAEKIKIKNGISPSSRKMLNKELEVVDEAIKSDLDILLLEIQSYFNLYVMTGRNRQNVEQITLVGGGSLLRNLDEYIMKKLFIPTIANSNSNAAIFALSQGILRR